MQTNMNTIKNAFNARKQAQGQDDATGKREKANKPARTQEKRERAFS